MPGRKIATCCYCGTRAALVLKGERRHELACASCGAPLHDLKRLKADTASAAAPARPGGLPVQDRHHAGETARRDARRRRKGSGIGRLKRRAFEELWDAIEDIFD
ncbi:hypothetical protein [Histidinibacterium lentulum]|uniref:TFIIB-type zinc ribbon-containing protein n=1 Tax=Histidinibacterium lentulum TaxID=2480588 RepID=A0A3N2QYD0_9RHOB|nr:hypothetical protein [Histidinibacterium lentulum]ROU00224.1 hypothetical protein EAT49_13285 [Histidinibacterium lentulum]